MNSKVYSLFRYSLLVSLLVAPSARGQDEEEEFTPRSSAPPAVRTGGASRGSSSEASAATVSILAPANTMGFTTREQPVIWWHLSADTEHSIEIAINDPNNLEKPVLMTTVKGPTKAGLHKLDLSELKQDGKPIKLQPNVKYDVAIEVVASKTAASQNPNATCRIMRLDPKETPAAAEREKDKAKLASIYAKEGIWFDYIDTLSAAIEAKPDDETLRQKRTKALAAQRLVLEPSKKDGAKE